MSLEVTLAFSFQSIIQPFANLNMDMRVTQLPVESNLDHLMRELLQYPLTGEIHTFLTSEFIWQGDFELSIHAAVLAFMLVSHRPEMVPIHCPTRQIKYERIHRMVLIELLTRIAADISATLLRAALLPGA